MHQCKLSQKELCSFFTEIVLAEIAAYTLQWPATYGNNCTLVIFICQLIHQHHYMEQHVCKSNKMDLRFYICSSPFLRTGFIVVACIHAKKAFTIQLFIVLTQNLFLTWIFFFEDWLLFRENSSTTNSFSFFPVVIINIDHDNFISQEFF